MSIPRALALGFCVFALSVTSVAAADGPTGGVVVGANVSSARLAGTDATGVDLARHRSRPGVAWHIRFFPQGR